MKKNIILLCASAMLLAGCGESGNPYVAEPSGGKPVEAKVVGEAAKKLAGSLEDKEAIGFELESGLKLDGGLSLKNAVELGPLAGKSFKANLDASAKASAGLVSSSTVLGSAALSASIKGGITYPEINVDPQTMSYKVEDKTVNLDAELGMKAYLEGTEAYLDLREAKEGVTKIYDAVYGLVGGFIGTYIGESASLPDDAFGRYKMGIPAEYFVTIAGLPTMFSSYAEAVAGILSNFDETVAAIEDSTTKKLLESLEFKTYDGGLYGIRAATDLRTIALELPIEDSSVKSIIDSLLTKIDASADFLLVFSETEIRSFGLDFKVNVNDLDFASFGGEEGVDFLDKINLNLEGGVKFNFAFNDAVNIARVTEKEAYEDLGPQATSEED